MKVNTQILKDMLSKVNSCKPSNILEITNYYQLQTIDNGIALSATDGVNYITVKHEAQCDQDIDVIVKGDQFSKLIMKTTKDTVDLKVTENYLQVKGNGTYKVEIVSDEIYPTPEFEGDKVYKVSFDTLSKSITGGKNAKSNVPTDGVLFSYLIRNKFVITADAIKVYSRDIKGKGLEDLQILIPPTLANLLLVLDTEQVQIVVNEDVTTLQAIGDNVVITGALAEGADEYPNVEPLLAGEYPNVVELDVKQVLEALDRLNLFIGLYDKGIIDLVFTGESLTLATVGKSVETVPYIHPIDDVEFAVSVNSTYLKDLFSAAEGSNIKLCFGYDETIKLITDDSTMLLATADEE